MHRHRQIKVALKDRIHILKPKVWIKHIKYINVRDTEFVDSRRYIGGYGSEIIKVIRCIGSNW